MTNLNLDQIYRFGQLVPTPKNEQLFLNIPREDGWLALPREKLSATETALLTQLFLETLPNTRDFSDHPWHLFLFDGQMPENITGSFRVIQFKLLNSVAEDTKDDWLLGFKSMFNSVTDAFFIDESYGIIVEEKAKVNYSLAELTGIMLTLESDFMVKTKAFLGSFFNLSAGFPRFFAEERELFFSQYLNLKGEVAFSLPQVALNFFTEKEVKASLIMQVFRKKLSVDTEMQEIITALWKNQGNISSAAKELFMHRNTLQYRLEKYHEQTGLSLKSMDDLVLSYLLVL